jgi:hypothetical protein
MEGIIVINEELYCVSGEKIQKINRDDIHRVFPRISMILGVAYMVSDDMSMRVKIDPESEFGKLVLTEMDLRCIESLTPENASQCLVPDEFKYKHCLLFGGKVLYSANTLEEIKIYEKEHSYIAFTTYIPGSNVVQ